MCDDSFEVRSERGSVTAEFAAVAPAIILVLALCVGALQVVTHRLVVADAAAEAARGLGRGDDVAVVLGHARRALGEVSLAREDEGEFVCAQLASPCPPGPFSALGLTVDARSCALAGGL
jgi:hypothetical protein